MTQWTETVNWLIPHIVHHSPVHFVFCEQFTDNLFMALLTSQQEAVTAILKEVSRQIDGKITCPQDTAASTAYSGF